MTERSNELKPCPFCGAGVKLVKWADEVSGELVSGHALMFSKHNEWYTPKCSSCDAMLNNGWESVTSAIEAWNGRACDD